MKCHYVIREAATCALKGLACHETAHKAQQLHYNYSMKKMQIEFCCISSQVAMNKLEHFQ